MNVTHTMVSSVYGFQIKRKGCERRRTISMMEIAFEQGASTSVDEGG